MSAETLEDLLSLSPGAFEQLVKKVFDGLGYKATVTGRSGDEGVDLVLEKGDERSIAQCKRYKGQVGQSIIREFYGTVIHEKAERGYVVTTGTFSLPAQTWARGKNLILVDGADLIKSIDTLGMQVEKPAAAHKEPDEIARLGQALREARDGKAYLRVAILGPPPVMDAYEPLVKAVAGVLHARLRFANGSLKARGFEMMMLALSSGDLLIVQELAVNPATARFFVDIVCSEGWMPRYRKRAPIDEVHILCGVWEPAKLQRLPLRQRMMFAENFPLQIDSNMIEWSDVHAWVSELADRV